MDGFNLNDLLLYLLLVATLALGWWLGRRQLRTGSSKTARKPGKDYFIGLNYLLNDEPDEAVDIFIDSLEVNSNTLETHMALGTLLRRRGKVDRSIAVYQDLLGQSGFSKRQLNDIKINLVQSYIAAGLLDRAEHLLGELRREKGQVQVLALLHSAKVYELEKDWQQAADALGELLRVCAPAQRADYQHLASHFYCELAQQELDNEHTTRAREYLKQAAAMDKANPRVSILLGDLERSSGNYKEAIRNYMRVKKQDALFMAEVFMPLVDCYQKVGKEKNLEKFIESCIREEAHASVILGLADYLEKERNPEEARRYLLECLGQKSSLRLLARTMDLEERNGEEAGDESSLYLQVLQKYLDSNAQYHCENCGFELKSLHWHCPSCSRWGTVKHVTGALGE